MHPFSFSITSGYMNRTYIEIRVYSLFLILTADILTCSFSKKKTLES